MSNSSERGPSLSCRKEPIRVLVVDDSATMRTFLTQALGTAPGIEVCGAAADPYEARDLIRRLDPDVLTLDIEMPKMSGLRFLRNLMRLRPMPVVMFSSLTSRGTQASLEALALGAIDCVGKPRAGDLHAVRDELVRKVKVAAGVSRTHWSKPVVGRAVASPRPVVAGAATGVIAIGASTGGTDAIERVLAEIGGIGSAAILIVQHFPPGFSRAFAERLQSVTGQSVAPAQDGEVLEKGRVRVAPSGYHLGVRKTATALVTELSGDRQSMPHHPSVDVLMRSVAALPAGVPRMAALLTGMGRDGADGMLRVRAAGGLTIAQDESSSVVWGMPGAAVELGAATEVLALGAVGARLQRWCARLP